MHSWLPLSFIHCHERRGPFATLVGSKRLPRLQKSTFVSSAAASRIWEPSLDLHLSFQDSQQAGSGPWKRCWKQVCVQSAEHVGTTWTCMWCRSVGTSRLHHSRDRREGAFVKEEVSQPSSLACKHVRKVNVSPGCQPYWLPSPGICWSPCTARKPWCRCWGACTQINIKKETFSKAKECWQGQTLAAKVKVWSWALPAIMSYASQCLLLSIFAVKAPKKPDWPFAQYWLIASPSGLISFFISSLLILFPSVAHHRWEHCNTYYTHVSL